MALGLRLKIGDSLQDGIFGTPLRGGTLRHAVVPLNPSHACSLLWETPLAATGFEGLVCLSACQRAAHQIPRPLILGYAQRKEVTFPRKVASDEKMAWLAPAIQI